jgi:hypothetical protein
VVTNKEGIEISGFRKEYAGLLPILPENPPNNFLPPTDKSLNDQLLSSPQTLYLAPNHDVFDPSRFLPLFNPSHVNLLLHFGQGPRQCIGRNVAMISIWKIVVKWLKQDEFDLVDKDEVLEIVSEGVWEKKGQLRVRIRRRAP